MITASSKINLRKVNTLRNKLNKIVKISIQNKDTDKLLYLFQTLDCLLFMEEHQNLKKIFKKVCNSLKVYPYVKLKDIVYKDLENIGIHRCSTFDNCVILK